MSRGIGKMQRAILDRLHARPGGDEFGRYRHDWFIWRAWLPEGIHDLRVVLREIQDADGRKIGTYPHPAIGASFSRAVNGLIDRGSIRVHTELIRIERYENGKAEAPVHLLSDGVYIFPPRRRFVETSNGN